MPEDASRFPIVQFLTRLMGDLGLTPAQLSQAVGYRNGRNAAKGLRRLNLWLETGDGYGRILNQIATVFPAYADGLQQALAATKAIRSAEFEAAWIERCKAEEASFVPFLYADGEKTVPEGICIFGMTGGHERWTMIKIPPTILALPLEDQLAALPKLMLRYRRLHHGEVPFFGRLTGFKFARLLDYFQFDAEGRLVEHVDYPFRCAPCSVELR
jgi:hypothetical protein